jgi:hypothetical protein
VTDIGAVSPVTVATVHPATSVSCVVDTNANEEDEGLRLQMERQNPATLQRGIYGISLALSRVGSSPLRRDL